MTNTALEILDTNNISCSQEKDEDDSEEDDEEGDDEEGNWKCIMAVWPFYFFGLSMY